MRLIATELAARRGEDLVFTGVSFELSSGGSLVVTGPNGVGKSTLLRLVAGLLAPHSGTLRLDGGTRGSRLAEHAHYLGHENAMKRELTVGENLQFWQRYMAGERTGPVSSVPEATEAVGLAAIAHLPFGYLSAGQQRRMAMAKLLVAHRPIWILDEPTSALDAASEALLAGLLADHCAGGGIVVAATHRPLGLGRPQRLEMASYRAAAEETE